MEPKHLMAVAMLVALSSLAVANNAPTTWKATHHEAKVVKASTPVKHVKKKRKKRHHVAKVKKRKTVTVANVATRSPSVVDIPKVTVLRPKVTDDGSDRLPIATMVKLIAGPLSVGANTATVFLQMTSSFIAGTTMRLQGVEKSVGWLNPHFRENLASAIADARQQGIEAAIFSAYRAPDLGVGGFRNKFDSCHSYGLAVDMAGIGDPGSDKAKRWHKIAAAHKVYCPYGPNHHVEWNHCQYVPQKVCGSYTNVRTTISGAGPKSEEKMFAAGDKLLLQATAVAAKSPTKKVAVASHTHKKSKKKNIKVASRHA